ncbi:MAG: SIS domain-containing protein [Clostridia bacterium]|nr:SIS domain-containing protein [Clostridia bacterium]
MSDDKRFPEIDRLIGRYPQLLESREQIKDGYLLLESCFSENGKLLTAGNGGSAADACHIAGELMKSFRKPRPVPSDFKKKLEATDPATGEELAATLERGLPVVPLVSQFALSTAYANDVSPEGIFAQQVYALGSPGDVLLAISTSGNSENVVRAAVAAKAAGLGVISLTGESGGRLRSFSDVAVTVPESETFLVQELHLPIYHCWCAMLEDRFF